MNLLISAFACYPGRGSEPNVGWGLSEYLSRKYQVTLLTDSANLTALQQAFADRSLIRLIGLSSLIKISRKNLFSEWLYYLFWQIKALQIAKQLHRSRPFDAVIHLTYVNSWLPSFLGYLNIPFLWCAGTRQKTNPKFLKEMSAEQGINEMLRNLTISTIGWVTKKLASRRNIWVVSSSSQREWGSKTLLINDVIGGLSSEDLRRLNLMNRQKTDAKNFRVVSIGRMLGLKGFSLGLKAFAVFHQKFPTSEYWLVGEGPEKRRLIRLAQQLRIEAYIKFIGWQPREMLFQLLGESDVLLHPSLHEQFGYVTLEAMAASCPVICLDTAGSSLLVNDAVGVKVRLNHPDQVVSELSDSLLLLAQNDGLRKQMAENARLYSQRWAWDEIGKKFEIWLERAVDDGANKKQE